MTCEAVTRSRNGAAPALCTVDGQDLGAGMVAAGMACTFTRYSNDYIVEEAQANIDRFGVLYAGLELANPPATPLNAVVWREDTALILSELVIQDGRVAGPAPEQDASSRV